MDGERQPSLQDALELVRGGLLPVVLAAVVVGGATYFVRAAQPTEYEAQATVVTTTQDPAQRAFGNTLVTAPALSTATYRAAALSHPVLERALEHLAGMPSSDESVRLLQGSLSVRTEEAQASALLRIAARAYDAELAQKRANAVAEALVEWDAGRATRSLETIVESLVAQIDSIDAEIAEAASENVAGLQRARADLALQLSSARALRAGAVGRIELFETAPSPGVPVSPRPLRDATAMTLLAVLAAYGLVFLRAAFDNRFRSLDDLAITSGLPALVAFPRVNGGRKGLPREAAAYLRTAIAFIKMGSETKIIQITSSLSGEGKTSVAIALSTSFARQHYRTILVEADLRQPTMVAEFGFDLASGASIEAALRGADPVVETVVLDAGVEYDVLPCVSPVADPAELLGANIPRLLQQLAADYDVVVVDSTPLLPVADALIVAPYTTGVVFVTSFADADRRTVRKASGLLRRHGIRPLGAVATKVPPGQHGASAYGLGYGDLETPLTSPGSRGDAALGVGDANLR